MINCMLNGVEREKGLITAGPGLKKKKPTHNGSNNKITALPSGAYLYISLAKSLSRILLLIY